MSTTFANLHPDPHAKPSIAYIGTGLMGLPMLRRLCSLGYQVTAFDIAATQM